MSGALATIGATAAVAGAVAEILGLGGSSVTLGEVTFADLALPPKMTWGGQQRLIRHVAPGGVVVISSLGPDWQPIAWRGILEGPSAGAQAQQLYAMMLAAQAISLSWMAQQWVVVIQDFYADDTTAGWVPYRITCAVSADPSLSSSQATPTLADQTSADSSSAATYAGSITS